MNNEEAIKDWTGKIIGYIQTNPKTGDQIIRDFYRRILGKYDKKLNVTRDFYGRIIAKGNQVSMLLNRK